MNGGGGGFLHSVRSHHHATSCKKGEAKSRAGGDKSGTKKTARTWRREVSFFGQTEGAPGAVGGERWVRILGVEGDKVSLEGVRKQPPLAKSRPDKGRSKKFGAPGFKMKIISTGKKGAREL